MARQFERVSPGMYRGPQGQIMRSQQTPQARAPQAPPQQAPRPRAPQVPQQPMPPGSQPTPPPMQPPGAPWQQLPQGGFERQPMPFQQPFPQYNQPPASPPFLPERSDPFGGGSYGQPPLQRPQFSDVNQLRERFPWAKMGQPEQMPQEPYPQAPRPGVYNFAPRSRPSQPQAPAWPPQGLLSIPPGGR